MKDIEFIRNFEKIYEVEFIEQDFINGDICKRDEDDNILAEIEAPIDHPTYVIPESKLVYYKQFGKGYRSIKLVGYMPIRDNEVKENNE